MQRPPDEIADLVSALRQRVTGEVLFDGWTRSLYSTDASLYQIMPLGVVVPRTVDDVQASVEIAKRLGAPVLARGSGTSLAGQAVGPALIIDMSRHLDRILSIDPDARTATVQPGITVAALNRTLAPLGLMLGPDPASADRATIGGCVGNNATGSHSILYGMMADNVLEAQVILADGSQVHFRPQQPEDLETLGRREGLQGAIYRNVPRIVREATPAILQHWPRHWRRASGYNLDRLAASLQPPGNRSDFGSQSISRPALCDPEHWSHFNVAQLLAGSEGTLAILTAVTIQLVPRPQRTALAVVHFENLLDACRATTDILELAPSACELLDRQLISLARRQPEWARKMGFVRGDPAAVLVVEFQSATENEAEGHLSALETHLRRRSWRGEIVRVLSPAEQSEIWSVRKAGLNLLMSRRGDWKPVPGIEDVSVPPERLADYLGRVLDWCDANDSIRDVGVYAHASAGCLHVRPVVNVKTTSGVATLQAMADMALELCLEYGGAMSGEHGDGLSRTRLNQRLFGAHLYEAMRQVKLTFDPKGLLNPGKVVDGPPLTESLRMGPAYETLTLDTIFDWSSDGGFAPAIEMCNGAGVCRKRESGVMCPSFMATRNERDSTRGRANALRNVLAGRIPHSELWSPEMLDVLDLCLSCKACKSECPSSVDMARIKAEYLVHYYHRNGLPAWNRLIGSLPRFDSALYQYARGAIPAVNRLLQSALFRRAQQTMGIDPDRRLPLYAVQSFEELFLSAAPNPKQGVPLILFHDTWTNYHEPEVGMAAVRVLRAGGYNVAPAWGRKCCGRTLITTGQADQARTLADHNVALLAQAAAQGCAIVGIEPSCILTLRDEYPALASDKARARLVASRSFTLEEFVVTEARQGRFAANWHGSGAKALLHSHCHARALVGDAPSVEALRLGGFEVEVVGSGCCGMAGDFGYKMSHAHVSRAIAEDRLLPTLRAAAPDSVIVASGTSCRHQIEHLAQRKSIHLAQALDLALSGS
jgi:FAD/FMN-containing dehydrogenase/Fe-S oxidoreductase